MNPETFNTGAILAQTVGAVAVVVLFLKHLKEERESREKIDIARHSALETIHDTCHSHSGQMMESVSTVAKSSTDVIAENNRVLGSLSRHLDELGAK